MRSFWNAVCFTRCNVMHTFQSPCLSFFSKVLGIIRMVFGQTWEGRLCSIFGQQRFFTLEPPYGCHFVPNFSSHCWIMITNLEQGKGGQQCLRRPSGFFSDLLDETLLDFYSNFGSQISLRMSQRYSVLLIYKSLLNEIWWNLKALEMALWPSTDW